MVSERPTEGGSSRKREEPAKKGKAGAAVEPFTLSDTIAPVPAKLVAKMHGMMGPASSKRGADTRACA